MSNAGDFIATAVYLLEDGSMAGEVIRRGSESQCRRSAASAPRIALEPPPGVIRSSIWVMFAIGGFDLSVGERWRMPPMREQFLIAAEPPAIPAMEAGKR